MAAGGVRLDLQVGLDLAYLRSQLAGLGSVAQKYSLPIKAEIDTRGLQKQLSALSREVKLNINDSQVTAATARVETLAKALQDLSRQKFTIDVGIRGPRGGAAGQMDILEGIFGRGLTGQAFGGGAVGAARGQAAREGLLKRLQAGSLSAGGYNVPGLKRVVSELGGTPSGKRDDLIAQAKKLIQSVDDAVVEAAFKNLKDLQMSLKPLRGTGLAPGSLFASRSAGNYQDILSSMAGLTKNPRAAALMLRQLPEERIRTNLFDVATRQEQYYRNVPMARQIQSETKGFDPLLKAIAKDFTDYTKSLNSSNPWIGEIGDGIKKVVQTSAVAAATKALPPVGGTTSPVNRIISQLAQARGTLGSVPSGALYASRNAIAPGIRMPGMAGTMPGFDKLANSLALLSNNALKARRSIEEIGFQNLPAKITGLQGAAFDKLLNQQLWKSRGVQPFSGQMAPIFQPTQGPARPSTVNWPMFNRGRFDRSGLGAGAGSFVPMPGMATSAAIPQPPTLGIFNATQGVRVPSTSSFSMTSGFGYQFPMSGMIGPSSPIGQINARTSMFGPSGPFGPGNRPPGGFYPGGGGPGGGGPVPPGGFPSAGMQGPQTQLGAGYFAAGKAINQFKTSYEGIKQYLNNNRLPLGGAIAEVGSEFGNAVKQVLLFGTAYKALAFFIDLPNQAFQAAKSLQTYENQLQAVTSTTGTFEQSFAFVDSLAQRFNVPLESARQGFVKLYASMQPAGFNQQQIEGLFSGISKATAAFGLSADKVDRVNYAFAQMASKGQIMSEELKGQLGDVLPGALALFARAAQMSIPEFSKAMEDGAFKGEAMMQVLRNVGILMNRDFGPAAAGASKTLQGALNQIQNNLKLMYESFNPIVNAFAAAFGPAANSLIKDVTDTMKTLTATFFGGAKAVDTLSPRALALYNTIQLLAPSFQSAGAAVADLGSRFAQLAPVMVQIVKLALDFISTPLARGLLIATLAVTALNGALVTLRAVGLTGALKAVYSFIGGLLQIPAATGIARIGIIALKLAVTGLFVGGILIGLDALIGKLLEIGDAASTSKGKVKSFAKELDLIAASGNVQEAAQKYMEANTELIVARRKNEKALSELRQARAAAGSASDPMEAASAALRLSKAQGEVDKTYSEVIAAQQKLRDARKTRSTAMAEDLKRQVKEQKDLEKVDLSGADEKAKKTNLEGYYSLQDQLAKDFTQAEVDRLERLHQAAMERLNAEYDLKEARANSFQKEALKFERKLMEIDMKRQKALLDASNEVLKAREGVVRNATGAGTAGAYLQGSIGPTSTGPHFDVKKVGGGYFSRDYLDKYVMVNGRPLSSGATVPGGTFAGHQRRGSHGWDYAFGPGRHAATLTGGAEWMEGASTAHGEQRRFRLPSGEIFQFLHGKSEGIGAGGARKVGANEKRDIVSAQKEQLALAKQSFVVRLAEEQAIRDTQVALAEYMATAAPVEEQQLQNSLLAKKNELIRGGMTDAIIEKEMKYFEASEKTRFGIEAIERALQKGIITKDQAAQATEELGNRLAQLGTLLNQGMVQEGIGKFEQSMSDLRKKMEQLQAPLGMERLVELQQSGMPADQAMQLFKTEEAISKMERLRDAVKGVADGINSSLGTALVDSILKFDSLNEVAANFLNSVAGYFRDLANTIIQEMTRAFVNQAVQSLLGSLFAPAAGILGGFAGAFGTSGPSFNSSIFSGAALSPGAAFGAAGAPNLSGAFGGASNVSTAFSGIKLFADGGVVTGPTLGLVGEGRFNEAVVPLPDGKSIPVDLGGAGNNISTNIVINVNNGQAQSSSSGGASDLGRKMEGAVKQVIVNEMRPGGLLSGGRR